MADHIVTTDRTPNGKWRWIHNAAPWQCVALRLNIDPDLLGIDEDGWVGKDHILNESQEFHDLLAAAEDAVLSGDLRSKSNGPPRYCTVSIREFMEWAAENEWEAPELMAAKPAQECPDSHTHSKERIAVEIPPANTFNDMEGLKWSEVVMTFAETKVRINARGKRETFTYEAMGFKNRKSLKAEPNRCWETLRCLAIVSTLDKSWNDVSPAVSRATFKKRMSQLRKQLQQFFGIADNPIAYRKGVGYKAAFNLQASSDDTNDERERRTADADDDDEDYQSEMSEVPYA